MGGVGLWRQNDYTKGMSISCSPYVIALLMAAAIVAIYAWWSLRRRHEIADNARVTILGYLAEGVLVLDSLGRVIEANRAAQGIVGAEGQLPPALNELMMATISSKQDQKAEVEIDQRFFQVTTTPLRKGGLVMILSDVTHFRQLAEFKDEFVSTVSHNLRSPLTSILGYAQMAQMLAPPEAKELDPLERIEAAARRMSDLVNNLLDLAMLKTGLDYELEAIELNRLAVQAIHHHEESIQAKGLTIKQKLSDHPSVVGDPRLIALVWRNLLDNAIRYTEEGTINLRVFTDENRVWGQVQDTGVGIPPAEAPYIFDKFFHSQRPCASGVKGTGLGLALAKSIVERHGGQIWVESEQDAGSTFTFTLPLTAAGDMITNQGPLDTDF